MTYLTTAEVDLGQIIKNYEDIKKHSGNAIVLCVVKANAYGHGAVECADALYKHGVRHFATANLVEAMEIKGVVKDSMILVLGSTPPEDAEILCDNGISQNIYSLKYAKELCRHIPDGKKVKAHLKVDTGMNRLGFASVNEKDNGQLDEITEVCTAFPKLEFEGIFTHFAKADDESTSFTEMQIERFEKTLAMLKDRGITFPLRHTCGSGAIYRFPEAHYDMVRAGIILYGYNPVKALGFDSGCEVSLTLKTTVTHIHTLKAGESISYGGIYTAEKDMKVATLAIGYADGLCRSYNGAKNNGGPYGNVVINGKECRLIGRICMDQCMCDVTDADVKEGDKAIVVDKNHTADVFSLSGDTIPNEFLCLLTQRAKRIYINSDI